MSILFPNGHKKIVIFDHEFKLVVIRFFIHLIFMKLGEVVVHIAGTHGNYNYTKFHQNQMKNKKVLIIDRLMEILSIKVPLRT